MRILSMLNELLEPGNVDDNVPEWDDGRKPGSNDLAEFQLKGGERVDVRTLSSCT